MRRCLCRCAAEASAAAAVAPLRPHQFRVIVREMRTDELPEFVRPRTAAAAATTKASAVRLLEQNSSTTNANRAAESKQAKVKAIEASTTGDAAATAAATAAQRALSADADPSSASAAASPAFVTAASPAVRHSADRFRSFQSLLHQQEQRSPVSLPIAPVVAAASAASPAEPSVRESLRSSVRKLLGIDVITAAVRVVSRLHQHCDRPVFRARLGFKSHPLSVIELRALHLWMMHVRLRDEPAPAAPAGSADGGISSVIPASYIESLFRVFWDRQLQLLPDAPPRRLQDLQEYAHGAFHALDHSLLALLRAQAEAEQQQQTGAGAGSAAGSKLKSAEYQPSVPLSDLASGADVLLLSSLWKNSLLGDRSLHPLSVAQLLRYVSATLARLYATPADQVWKGKFEWLDPESVLDSSVAAEEPVDEQQAQAYFDMLDKQINPSTTLPEEAAQADAAA